MSPETKSSPLTPTKQTAASGEDCGLRGALARGIAAKRDWVTSGEVALPADLAERWRCEPDGLVNALAQRDLFTVEFDGSFYVPVEFLVLEAPVVAAICRSLDPLTDTEKLVFWKRDHGALGGKSVLACLKADGELGLERILRLAREHTRERMGKEVDEMGTTKDAPKNGAASAK